MNENVLRKKSKNQFSKKDILSWLIGLPSLLLFIFFIWGPLFQNIIYSFFKTSNFDLVSFNGLDNYIEVFKDSRFIGALENTVLYVIYSLIIGFIVPIILALLISEVVWGKSIFKIGFYIPNIVPAIAVILMWKIMMDANDYGFFNIILNKLGLSSSQWIADEKLSIPLIILTLTWKSAGSTMLIYLATIQSIDNSLYEAARIKRLSVWKRLRYITIPALLPNIKLLLIIQIISIFQIFYEPMVFMGLTNNSANTLGLLIYKFVYTTQNTGQAAALGVITMLLLLVFTFIYLFFDRKTSKTNLKVKKYISYEEVLKLSEKKEENILTRISKKTKEIFISFFKLIYKFFEKIKLIAFLQLIKKGLNFLFDKSFQLSKRIFRSKNNGILVYSDYKKPSRRLGYYLMFTILMLGMIVVLVPFIWLFVTSFKNANEIYQLPKDYHFFPTSFDFGKYVEVISKTEIMRNVGNSVIIAIGAAFCAIVFNGLLAYVVSVLRPKGSKLIFYLVLGSMLIPATVALVPLYKNITSIYEIISKISGLSLRKIQSTFLTLIPFWFIAGASPFYFLLFKSHFDSLPKDLFEVAALEGATKLQTFTKIIVPLSVPTIMVVGIFAITAAWNDFLLPYIVINNQSYWTVMVKLFKVNAEMAVFGITLDQFLSLLLFTMIPPVIIFFIFQKRITSNVATTGIK
jgi:multiple sugar transport system permease protein